MNLQQPTPIREHHIPFHSSFALSLTDAIEGKRLDVQALDKHQPVFRRETEVLGQARALRQAGEVGAPLEPLFSKNLRTRRPKTTQTTPRRDKAKPQGRHATKANATIHILMYAVLYIYQRNQGMEGWMEANEGRMVHYCCCTTDTEKQDVQR